MLELRPDLVLSDVMMPEMSGETLVREIRARPELDAMPVVLLTAKGDDALRVELLREGAQDYVTKPFSAEELRARVANLVTMKRARASCSTRSRASSVTCRPWPKRSLSLTLSLGPDLTSLEGDRRLVSLILVNLIGNAIKFTEQGVIEVSVGCGGGEHRLVVKDSGPGIPPDRQHLVFEPFEQLEPVRDKHTPGVGLGLSLVREMLDAIGGRVELSSTVGVGSTFTVLLPSTATALRASGRLKTAV